MSGCTIATLAREAGLGVETVRFYQRRGLMPTPGRWSRGEVGGGIRRYEVEDVVRGGGEWIVFRDGRHAGH